MAEHTINLPRSAWDEVMSPPPAGHRGCYVTLGAPAWKEGDVLIFCIYTTEEIGRGIVTEIEPPGKCRRADLEHKALERYKSHWEPVQNPLDAVT